MSDQPRTSQSSKPPKIAMVVIDVPNRKHNHLAIIRHRGGGWYDVRCFGQAKKCKAGVCEHTAHMRWESSERPIRQVPVDA